MVLFALYNEVYSYGLFLPELNFFCEEFKIDVMRDTSNILMFVIHERMCK